MCASKKRSAILHFGSEKIDQVPDSDGPCGSGSADLARKQKELYLDAKTDLDAKNIFSIARAGASASRLINYNHKVAMAIEDCHGDVEGHELVGSYEANIIFFKGDYEISFYVMGIDAPSSLTIGQSEEFLKHIKPNGDSITEKMWDGLTDIVRSISYE